MKIVIIGAGFGGLETCFRLRRLLKDRHDEIILISDIHYFLFRPSLIWIPFREREISDISLPLKEIIKDTNITFMHKRVTRIVPQKQMVELDDNETVHYDYLVIASGAELDFQQINGDTKKIHSIYTIEGALKVRQEIQKIADGDSIVIGSCAGNPNPSPSYEFTFELHAYLQKKNINASITYFTSEDQLFHFAISESTEHVTKLMNKKGITYFTDTTVTKMTDHHVQLSNHQVIPYTFLLVIPPYKGADFILNSELHHENGLLRVKETLQSEEWENIFVVGDACILPKRERVKSGRAAELQGSIAAENIFSKMTKRTKQKNYEDQVVSIVETGTDGGMLSVLTKHLEIHTNGSTPHVMKIMLEKYYLQKLKGQK
ncbi:FAD-dependent oxidoreductase [Bacillus sp. FJAT-47783]|uniref:NAD(P)/FAD-dependent oxidoreductase n=1 Tax=Bacillus sp. FJAT-47783 TaxID=2922712 RepID=UPI001FACE1E0|nr:FAD-dependent oxidoreductase [Bacillus sp. FJAT-47783]